METHQTHNERKDRDVKKDHSHRRVRGTARARPGSQYPPPALAQESEPSIQPEAQDALIELFKTDYTITDPEYGVVYAHKYVSDDGTEEKWYSGYLPEIGGLKRTDERIKKRTMDFADGDVCEIPEDIHGDYAHLYLHSKEYYLRPFYSCEKTIDTKYGTFIRTRYITQIDEWALELLHKGGLCRMSDNIFYYQADYQAMEKKNYAGFLRVEPLGIDENGDIVLQTTILDKTPTPDYEKDINGYLFMPQGYLAINDTLGNQTFVLDHEEINIATNIE